MKTPLRAALALVSLLTALHAAPAVPAAPADESGTVDSGRLIVLDHGTPVGYEDFEYERRGDSLLVSAIQTRSVRDTDGTIRRWQKKLGLVADAHDFGLRGYTSNLEFGGSTTIKGVIPGDTAMTVYREVDGRGDALRLAQPPGRLFVMDPMMFTLFDVICRNVGTQSLAKRPLELVTLGEEPGTARAQATAAGPDTIQWAGQRMIARRFLISDEKNTFVAWVSPRGQMLRLLDSGGSVEVLREEPRAEGAPKPHR